MNIGFEFVAARSKKADADAELSFEPMRQRARKEPRKQPSTDEKKIKRRLTKSAVAWSRRDSLDNGTEHVRQVLLGDDEVLEASVVRDDSFDQPTWAWLVSVIDRNDGEILEFVMSGSASGLDEAKGKADVALDRAEMDRMLNRTGSRKQALILVPSLADLPADNENIAWYQVYTQRRSSGQLVQEMEWAGASAVQAKRAADELLSDPDVMLVLFTRNAGREDYGVRMTASRKQADRPENSWERGYNTEYEKNKEEILKDGPKCAICGEAKATEVDHIKSLNDGGGNGKSNLRPACKSCNRKDGGGERSDPKKKSRKQAASDQLETYRLVSGYLSGYSGDPQPDDSEPYVYMMGYSDGRDDLEQGNPPRYTEADLMLIEDDSFDVGEFFDKRGVKKMASGNWYVFDEGYDDSEGFDGGTYTEERPIAGPFASQQEAAEVLRDVSYPFNFPYGPPTVMGEMFIAEGLPEMEVQDFVNQTMGSRRVAWNPEAEYADVANDEVTKMVLELAYQRTSGFGEMEERERYIQDTTNTLLSSPYRERLADFTARHADYLEEINAHAMNEAIARAKNTLGQRMSNRRKQSGYAYQPDGQSAFDVEQYDQSPGEPFAHPSGHTYSGPEPVESNDMRLAGRSSTMQREADILEAMRFASLSEQRQLMAELNEIRANRKAAVEADREVDLTNAVIRDRLTPVLTKSMHTVASDWLDEVAADDEDEDEEKSEKAEKEAAREMVAQATVWFKRLSSEVVADREEFAEQARGKARQLTSSLGTKRQAAIAAFLDAAAHLRSRVANEMMGYDGDYATNLDGGMADSLDMPMDDSMDMDPRYVTNASRKTSERREIVLPYSEVAMHMGIAGERLFGELTENGRMVQLFDADGNEVSFPITRGEAGWDMQHTLASRKQAMPQKYEVDAYTADELTGAARDRARQAWDETNDWVFDQVQEDAQEELARMLPSFRGWELLMEIGFSQGDGVWLAEGMLSDEQMRDLVPGYTPIDGIEYGIEGRKYSSVVAYPGWDDSPEDEAAAHATAKQADERLSGITHDLYRMAADYILDAGSEESWLEWSDMEGALYDGNGRLLSTASRKQAISYEDWSNQLDAEMSVSLGDKFPFFIVTKDMMETYNGVAWVADLYMRLGESDAVQVGTVENDGNGGPDIPRFDNSTARRQWSDFVDSAFQGNEERATLYLVYQEDAKTASRKHAMPSDDLIDVDIEDYMGGDEGPDPDSQSGHAETALPYAGGDTTPAFRETGWTGKRRKRAVRKTAAIQYYVVFSDGNIVGPYDDVNGAPEQMLFDDTIFNLGSDKNYAAEQYGKTWWIEAREPYDDGEEGSEEVFGPDTNTVMTGLGVEARRKRAVRKTAMRVDDVLPHAIEALWFAGSTFDGEILDSSPSYADVQMDPSDERKVRDSLEEFLRMAADYIEYLDLTAEEIGHNYVFSATGQGTGFWDRGLGDVGENLHDLAKMTSKFHEGLYGDGGQVFLSSRKTAEMSSSKRRYWRSKGYNIGAKVVANGYDPSEDDIEPLDGQFPGDSIPDVFGDDSDVEDLGGTLEEAIEAYEEGWWDAVREEED